MAIAFKKVLYTPFDAVSLIDVPIAGGYYPPPVPIIRLYWRNPEMQFCGSYNYIYI